MKIETQTVTLRKLTASEGMVLTDSDTRTLRTKEIYLGKNEDEENFVEVNENTPLPASEEETTE